MIAQQMRIVYRIGSLLALVVFVTACSSMPQAPVTTRTPMAKVESSLGHSAAQIALQQIGVPYRYGGQTPSGFDCSGLVHYSYYRAGKSVPRTTAALWSGTRPVARSELQVGDLLFFSISGKMSHVGLYVGDNRFVHAPSSGKTVNVQSLSTPYYQNAFLRAGRPR